MDHCEVGFVSVWSCDCGAYFRIICTAPNEFRLQVLPKRIIKTIVTLESSGPVRLIVQGMEFTRDDGSPDPDAGRHDSYFYDEHTCPTNYIGGSVLKVIDPADGDNDPHGIFAYVKTEPWRDLDVSD